MQHYAHHAALPTEYEAFLQAAIGDGRNGLSLTVLSVFARLGVDPWEESARLSKLPKEAALQALAAAIASLPDEPSIQRDSAVHAARLAPLLHNNMKLCVSPENSPPQRGDTAIRHSTIAFIWFIAFVTFAFAVVTRQVDSAPASSSSTNAQPVHSAATEIPPPPANSIH
jgi:hypothetical protein